jgi:ATP-dependent protease ClpP protease subunit|tara:strand:+ start:560 stop:787 length:228 start_codon:yes stop_codon:yes gene_type:complete
VGWKLGDVRGVLEVPTVIESQGAKLNTIVLGLVAATGTIIILAYVYFARKIAAPPATCRPSLMSCAVPRAASSRR